jgi:hypothetical protein
VQVATARCLLTRMQAPVHSTAPVVPCKPASHARTNVTPAIHCPAVWHNAEGGQHPDPTPSPLSQQAGGGRTTPKDIRVLAKQLTNTQQNIETTSQPASQKPRTHARCPGVVELRQAPVQQPQLPPSVVDGDVVRLRTASERAVPRA